MAYYTTLNYSSKADFKDIEKLNNEIKNIDDGHAELSINKSGEIECGADGYYGKFYEDREFAELLSEYIESGSVDITYTGEDGTYGYRIFAGKIKELKSVILDEDELEDYRKFKNYKEENLNEIFEGLFIPQWFNKDDFSDMLNRKLTDYQFLAIKEYLMTNGSTEDDIEDLIFDIVKTKVIESVGNL